MKEPKFKIGDLVIGNDRANSSYNFTKKGWIGKVEKLESFTLPWEHNGDCIRVQSIKDPREKYTVSADCFDLYEPHKGKILIMVDEKDPNKIIARDLITNKTAEAKRNPKDDWDFAKGAKLALERLTELEKPKGWTGKVVCIQADHHWIFGKFVKGKIYRVENGRIFCEDDFPWIRLNGKLFMSADEVDSHFSNLTNGVTRFIEYKGGAEE